MLTLITDLTLAQMTCLRDCSVKASVFSAVFCSDLRKSAYVVRSYLTEEKLRVTADDIAEAAEQFCKCKI